MSSKKITNICDIFEKNAKNALETNIGSFQQILAQNKVYNYFIIGHAKTLVKLKEK